MVKRICSVDNCENSSYCRTMCTKHYERWRKHGDPLVVHPPAGPPRLASPSYDGAHARVRRSRGKASDHKCVDCGRAACDWSYDHSDPNELYGAVGSKYDGIAYSLNPDHYQPRCKACHLAFDRT